MTSLYDLLGVPPDASADEIRHAYYRAARQRHPDVNPDADAAAAMRRLNEAWETLGDPIARRRYDAQLRPATPAPRPPAPDYEPDLPAPHPPRFLRPSALIVAVLLLIFVVTAYAGHGTNDRFRPTPPTSAATATTAGGGPTNLIGDCLDAQPGYDAVVPCTQHNLG
ncbi:MAG TPA: J domain-containing protein, partial [Acidimicrobiales bacterium]|nr:J domain-containing protein [Acidimicrobiales bacterium]